MRITKYDMRNKDKEWNKLQPKPLEAVITIGMPAKYRVPRDIFLAYLRLIKPKHYFITVEHVPIDVARNAIVEQFLVDMPDATHLLFWDSDVIPNKDTLWKLFRHSKKIVSALYFQKYPPHRPHLYVRTETGKGFIPFVTWQNGQCIEVEGCGMGFCLIRKDVFQLLEPPWYSFKNGLGEDFYFCVKARESANIKTYVDTDAKCMHVTDNYPVTHDTFKMWMQKESLKMVQY